MSFPLNRKLLPYYSQKLLLYYIFFLFTIQQTAPQCLLHSIQVPLFSCQGPLRFNLIFYDHITYCLHSSKLRVLSLPKPLCLCSHCMSPPPNLYLSLFYHSRPSSRPVSSIKPLSILTHHNFSHLGIFTRVIDNFKTEWFKIFS